MAQITIMAVYGFCGDTPWWPPQVIYGSHHHNENIKACKKYIQWLWLLHGSYSIHKWISNLK